MTYYVFIGFWEIFTMEQSRGFEGIWKYGVLGKFLCCLSKVCDNVCFLLNCYDSDSDKNNIEHEEVAEFCMKYCEDCESFCDIFEDIEKVEIKNSLKKCPAAKLKQIISLSIWK